MRALRVLSVVLLMTLTSCSWFSSKGGSGHKALRAFTAELRLMFDDAEPRLHYRDACGGAQAVAVGDMLTETMTIEVGRVFGRVQTEQAGPAAIIPDRVIRVDLKKMGLVAFVGGTEPATYPATVSLGATVLSFDAAGTMLGRTQVRADVEGEVNTDGQGCEVHGIQELTQEAVAEFAEKVREHLEDSKRLLAGVMAAEVAHAQRLPGGTPEASRDTGSGTARPGGAPAQTAGQPASLSFRALVADANRNQVMESGETLTVEVEVKNAGPAPARGVQLHLSGSPELIQHLPNPVDVGDLQAGESKAVKVSGNVAPVSRTDQAELLLTLASASPADTLPPPKRFLVAVRPARAEDLTVLSVDVDQVPAGAKRINRSNAVGIAIGISQFRDSEMPAVKYAARDAETMGKYFEGVMGIPKSKIRVATDDHALRGDFVEIFRSWLPRQISRNGDLFLYIAGRAVVDPKTGALAVIPYDGDPQSPRRLIGLPQLHAVAGRLHLRQAVFFLDLSVMPALKPGSVATRQPVWDGVGPPLNKGKLIQIFGASAIQEALQYEEGQHGLFTYHLLKGLSGAADKNRTGFVTIRDLCGYVREKVGQAAKRDYGTEQAPQCVPSLSPEAKVWRYPVVGLR